MTAEELYQKEFGTAYNVPKEKVIKLLKRLENVLRKERNKTLRMTNMVCVLCMILVQILFNEQK